MDHISQFREAFKKYLNNADLYPLLEEDKLTSTGEYRHICFMKIYHREGGEVPYRLLVPTISWHEFLAQIDQIFETKINSKLLNRTIDRVICEFEAFPFSDEILADYAEKVFEVLWSHFQLWAEALVPLFNVRVTGILEFPIANTIFHSGHPGSMLAHKIRNDETNFIPLELADKHFLKIQVTGDEESRLKQVEYEAELALKVLRFVTMWQTTLQGTKQKRFNSASNVTIRESFKRHILFHRPDNSDLQTGYHADFETQLFLSIKDLETAREYFGLGDLNYHCQNLSNQISKRVLNALELYDSGTKALTNWQAMYRYVACVNVAIPTSSHEASELVKYLSVLIQYGGWYVGTMRQAGSNTDPDVIPWKDKVSLTTEPFQQFYVLRSQILHGNLYPEEDLSDQEIEEARLLSHNAVRLMAQVAREFKWQNYKEAKNWFNSPVYPPRVDSDASQQT